MTDIASPLHEAQEFWNGLEQGELHIQRCTKCGEHIFYPRIFCPHDFGELIYVKTSGKGKILSYSIVAATPDPRFKGSLPQTIAVVELEEGPSLYTQIIGDAEKVTIGQPVVLQVEKFAGQYVPKFKI